MHDKEPGCCLYFSEVVVMWRGSKMHKAIFHLSHWGNGLMNVDAVLTPLN